MAERAKRILKQLLDIWKKYTSKQKTLIISAVCVVIFAFSLLIFLIQRTDYVQFMVAESPSGASQIVDVLKSSGYKYKVAGDNVTISIDAKHQTDAVLLMAENDIPTTGMSIDELLNNSLSTTNADRTLKINLYFQNQLKNRIMKMEGVEEAEVYYLPSQSKDSILAEAEDTSASIMLTTNDDFKASTAETIAKVVAAVIGNKNADKIMVSDQRGTLLYGGGDDLYSGSPNGNEDFKERLRNTYINNLHMGLLKSGWDDAVIIPNLSLDMDAVTELEKQYTAAEGQEQGLYSHSYTYNSENAGTSGGTPGTSANDGTTDYLTPDSTSSNGTVEINEYDYLPNYKEINTQHEVGAVIPENSSIGIVLTRVKTIKQEELELQGLLQGTTFEQYALQNSARVTITADQNIIDLVAASTGIAAANIKINAYEQPVFIPKAVTVRSWTDYLQIILAVLIVALLVFVVFKGVKPVEVTELEPELSVEQLLATTKENQTIEDIEFNEVSEVRKMIEKFVDEKPEAVAQLLRNWLNEDWN